MSGSLKVQPHHLERSAYLYVRQSSMRQVIENVESTKRQYALRSRAIALGWRDDQIIVIDNDQGESGASAAWREGFQRLVSDVGMGHAGIVMGLEVSRLARNNADWCWSLASPVPVSQPHWRPWWTASIQPAPNTLLRLKTQSNSCIATRKGM